MTINTMENRYRTGAISPTVKVWGKSGVKGCNPCKIIEMLFENFNVFCYSKYE
jgi:hypothetical protein